MAPVNAQEITLMLSDAQHYFSERIYERHGNGELTPEQFNAFYGMLTAWARVSALLVEATQ